MNEELKMDLEKLQEEASVNCSCVEKRFAVHSFDEHFKQVKVVCECGVIHDFPEREVVSLVRKEDGSIKEVAPVDDGVANGD